MYWLLTPEKQKEVRSIIDHLVLTISEVNHKPPHSDQIFPFQGRKAINHAKSVIELLTDPASTVCDPFTGSGSFSYAGATLGRHVFSNEYEPYTHKMIKLPFSLPNKTELRDSLNSLLSAVKPKSDYYYRSKCNCGENIVIDSLFFDRVPLSYSQISRHERLGPNGENITFRGKNKCPSCGSTEKFFDDFDKDVIDEIDSLNVNFPQFRFIENSRINLGKEFLDYQNLFPKRSQVIASILWEEINKLNSSDNVVEFLQCTFLSIIPLMKYKDYRSKSQDLHCPPEKLRETNILNAYIKQFEKRFKTLYAYNLNDAKNVNLSNADFRDFLCELKTESVDLVITDPPWHDGSAYFERAQLYHPWIDYNLKNDQERLKKEVVVSDSPERPDKNNDEQWWSDINDFFNETYRVLKASSFIVLYFRPVPASQWIQNFNRLKLLARKNGFEPLLTIDLSNNDPSMRVQQSAHYAFSSDLILTFVKLDNDERRIYFGDHDIDEIAFRCSVEIQDEIGGSFTRAKWNQKMFLKLKELGLHELALPKNRITLDTSFSRICDEVQHGQYLPTAISPYSDEIFNTPYIERVSLYIPYVIEELLQGRDRFTFDQFLLKVAEFVENGTRAILEDILSDGDDSIHSLLNMYAEPIEGGKYFTKRPTPQIPEYLNNLLELDPYEFEAFTAKLLELEGYTNVVISGRAGDRGVDVRCNNAAGELVIVQCKRYTKSKIGSTPIQRLHSFANTRGAKEMICITTTDFTPDGYDEAKLTGVKTINRTELEKIVHKHEMFSSSGA